MPLTSLYFIVLQSPFLCIQIHSLKFKQAQHLVFPALFEQLLSIISIDVSSGIPSFPTTTLFKTVCISKQICQFSLTWTLSLDQVLSATPGALTLSAVQVTATVYDKGLSQWCSLELQEGLK